MVQTGQSPVVGTKLGASPYRLVKGLGTTSLAELYLAEELHQGGKVVVKLPLRGVFEQQPAFAKRLAEHIGMFRKFEHAHFVKVIDQGEFEGRPFLVVPNCSAGDLQMRMATGPGGQLAAKPPENLAGWLLPAAQALDHLHGLGFVHRDVCPTRVLFDEQGRALLDEPVLTAAPLKGSLPRLDGLSFGTPRYMAPEALAREVLDGRADQFSLAMMVWEWLSGRALFKGESASEVAAVHKIVLSFLPPWLPAAWKNVLKRALARKAEDRYPTCEEFARDLLVRLDGASATAAAGDDSSFDLACPEEEAAAAPPSARTKLSLTPTRLEPVMSVPTKVATRVVETPVPPPSPAFNTATALDRLAAAERAHLDFSVWFSVINGTELSVVFGTRGRNWEGSWTPWVKHTLQPGQSLPIYCQGVIGIQLRYFFRLGDVSEYEHAEVHGQIWPSAARPSFEEIAPRYRFAIQGGLLRLSAM